MTVSAVLVAAGCGKRMNARVENKLLAQIASQPLLCRTVSAFAACGQVDEIVLVVAENTVDSFRKLLLPFVPDARFVMGGKMRRDSSLAGVRAATGTHVLVHDGARPFPSAALIERVIRSLQEHDAVLPVLPCQDALHVAVDGELEPSAEAHAGLPWVRAQTPQGFRRELLVDCLEKAAPGTRDEASAVLAQGTPVFVVPGEHNNLKVTVPEDLIVAEELARFLAMES